MVVENIRNLMLISNFIKQTPEAKISDNNLKTLVNNLPSFSEEVYDQYMQDLIDNGYISAEGQVTPKGQKFSITMLSAKPDKRYVNLNFDKVVNGESNKGTTPGYKASLLITTLKALNSDFEKGIFTPDQGLKSELDKCCDMLTNISTTTPSEQPMEVSSE